MSPPESRGRLFWAGVVVGWAVIGYGVAGLLTNARDTRPGDLARWFLGAALAHDGMVAPLVCLTAWLLARSSWPPARMKAPIQGGLIVSAAVALFAWPFLRGYGLRADNSSALPNNYARGLLVVLGMVWMVSAALVFLAWRRTRHSTVS